MLNDVFPNQQSKEKIYYGKTLPTVNITPKKWQTDYLKNFGNKK